MEKKTIYLVLDLDSEVICATETREEAFNIVENTDGLDAAEIEETTLYCG